MGGLCSGGDNSGDKPASSSSANRKSTRLDSKQSETFKIIVVGDGGVGKSAITIQFIQGRFEEEYDPTIEDTYQKFLEVDRRKVCINVVDTAGQEDYLAMRDSWLRMGDGFVLVFSLTEPTSWNEVKTIREQIKEAKESDSVPMVIVGNKKDLVNKRQIAASEVTNFLGAADTPYIEASAKTSENIETIFLAIVRQCRKYPLPKQNGGR